MSVLEERLRLLMHYFSAKRAHAIRSESALQRHQQKRWQWMQKNVLRHSPFYQASAGKSLAEFPLMDKQSWMHNFDFINTRKVSLKTATDMALKAECSRDFSPLLADGISIGLSTGTSGHRGLFLAAPGERLRWAATMMAKLLPAGLLSRERVALCLRTGNSLYDTVTRGGRLQFFYADLTRPFEQVVAELSDYKPTILVAPARVLRLLAENWRSDTPKPRRVIASAEMLDEIDRCRIEALFSCRVEQIYQATEGFLGVSCAHGSLHLNEDVLLIEKQWLDEARTRFIPVITDLYRSTQPVIRYRLNDVLSIRKLPCPCGSVFTAIDHIDGREDDIIYVKQKNGEGMTPLFPDILTRVLCIELRDLNDYQFDFVDNCQLRISTQPELNLAQQEQVHRALCALIQRMNGCPPPIVFLPLGTRDLTQKCRRVRVLNLSQS